MGGYGESVPGQDRQEDQLVMRAVAILMLSWAAAAVADQGSAFRDGQNLGRSVNPGAFAGINSGAAADRIPRYGTQPVETQLFQGGQGQLAGPGIQKMHDCAQYVPGQDRVANQECEAINLLARNPQVRPQFNITKNDPMILAAKHTRNNAENFFRSISGGTGSSSQCTTNTVTTPAQYTTETCTVIREVGQQQCTMGRVINIDTDANFQCEQTVNAYETLKCRRGSDVMCTGGGDGCDRGGIIPNSWAGDMATRWFPDGAGNYILQFGTVGDNYWCGWAITVDRTLTFTISDVHLLTRFALTHASFDDWILVQVNGTTVYVGPHGGDRLQVVNQTRCATYYWGDSGEYEYCDDQPWVQYGPNSFGWPELNTSWNIGLNIDLRPYLRNGTNTIFMRVIVAGCGEGVIQLTTRQKCPLQCSVSTRNDCAALEARSR